MYVFISFTATTLPVLLFWNAYRDDEVLAHLQTEYAHAPLLFSFPTMLSFLPTFFSHSPFQMHQMNIHNNVKIQEYYLISCLINACKMMVHNMNVYTFLGFLHYITFNNAAFANA